MGLAGFAKPETGLTTRRVSTMRVQSLQVRRSQMPKYEIKATLVIEAEAVIEADDFDDAVAIATDMSLDDFTSLADGELNIDSVLPISE